MPEEQVPEEQVQVAEVLEAYLLVVVETEEQTGERERQPAVGALADPQPVASVHLVREAFRSERAAAAPGTRRNRRLLLSAV